MPFQTPITIAKALDRIHRHEFVLPAIQREFVWSTEQICRLFDSLMRGYPFGSFLFWKVQKANTRKYVFYDFVQNYHERDAPRCPRLTLSGDDGVTAVLDGQQRLTALNIGLRGSHAEKLPHKRRSNAAAYPKCHLYLDLLSEGEDDELGLRYRFAFLPADVVEQQNAERSHNWFRAGDIVELEPGPQMFEYLLARGLTQSPVPFKILDRLHHVIHRDMLVNYYEEEDQDLDKVLNVFIRVNSGGTVLSYADLLLSIATAQWSERDAREEVYGLVDDLNKVRNGFKFPKDLALKSSLVLADISDVGFKVKNFNAENMGKIEAGWDALEHALRLAVDLLAQFGFSADNLTANNVVIPVAYYLLKRGATESYLNSRGDEPDRDAARLWVTRSLVKPGIWGSGLDTLLRALRAAVNDVVEKRGEKRFPAQEMEAAMKPIGKSLSFEEEEIGALLDSRYGHQGTFAVLSLLYPGHDLRNEFHVDHVFPRALFTTRKLRAAGIADADIEELQARVDLLPNLHLLLGAQNVQKSAQLPAAWLTDEFADASARGYYLTKHDLGEVPQDLDGFLAFFEARKARIAAKLRKLLGVSAS